ncbi:MAG: hypothetical protein MI867_27225 [Pseudomonadales bacterium]|nr:hypothetical protein [Pseudomonadales bacterium]
MYFLCSKHRQKLICLPEDQISGYWLDWMLDAGQEYEIEDWQRAKLYAGSAMDLASSALLRSDIDHENMAIHATLATIYTANCCQHCLEPEHAYMALDFLRQRLRYVATEKNQQDWVNKCIDALRNPIRQSGFFQEYLSIPLRAATISTVQNTPITVNNNVITLH